jgi:aminopeptidase N
MIFEMLRYDMGDDVFRKAFSAFYQKNKFKKASWDDIMIAFENATIQKPETIFRSVAHAHRGAHLETFEC